jgi:hypothetical protein
MSDSLHQTIASRLVDVFLIAVKAMIATIGPVGTIAALRETADHLERSQAEIEASEGNDNGNPSRPH